MAQIDSDYASRIGIPQVLVPEDIRSVAFNCAVLDNARMGRSEDHNPMMDFGGDVCARSYLGVSYLDEGDAAIADSNVIKNVTFAMPPCYIDDGTSYTYGDQAKELAAHLEELGVEHVMELFQGKPHSFDTTDSEAARESLDLQIAFMDHFTGRRFIRGVADGGTRRMKVADRQAPSQCGRRLRILSVRLGG